MSHPSTFRHFRQTLSPHAIPLLWAAFFASRLALYAWGCTRPSTDLAVFFAHAESWLTGLRPFADFAVEYPPGALALVSLPALLTSDFGYYRLLFYLSNLLADVAIVALLLTFPAPSAAATAGGRASTREPRRDASRPISVAAAAIGTGPAWLYLVGSSALLDAFLHRFDLWPTLVTLIALRFWILGKHPLAAFFLALGATIKLWPALFLPLLLVESWRSGGLRASARTALGLAVGAALVGLPFLLLVGPALFRFFSAVAGHGLLPESLWGSLLLVLRPLGLSLRAVQGSGSWELVGGPAGAIVTAAPYLVLAAWLLLTTRFALTTRRSGFDTPRLPTLVAILLAFMLLNKFFSPQYLLWLLPFAGLATVGRQRAALAALLLVGSAVLSSWLWPFHYYELLRLETRAAWIALLKNALLVGLFVLSWRNAAAQPETRIAPATAPQHRRQALIVGVLGLCFLVALGGLFARPAVFHHADKGYLRLALQLYRDGRLQRSIDALGRCIRDYPQAITCAERRALLQIERGDARGAERTLLDLLRRSPNRIASWRSLARLYRAIGAESQFPLVLERLERELGGRIDRELPPFLRKLWKNGTL